MLNNPIDTIAVKKMALILRAVNHKLRQIILKYIESQGEAALRDIYIKLRLDPPMASQQIAILHKADILIRRKEGKRAFFRINEVQVERLNKILTDFLPA